MNDEYNRRALSDELDSQLRILSEDKKKTVRVIERFRQYDFSHAEGAISEVVEHFDRLVSIVSGLKKRL